MVADPKSPDKDRQPKSQEAPGGTKKSADRSRHMAWSYDDVEHHGQEAEQSEGTRKLKRFKTWTAEKP